MHPSSRGFTLIELAIVVAIVAALIGGVVIGKQLIHQSEIRRAVGDAKRYIAATQQFRQKYRSVPGDMPDAESYWGTDTYGGGCWSTADETAPPLKETCNGDGDGRINKYEMFHAWQHLSNAGMIDGMYNGKSKNGSRVWSYISFISGINAPTAPLGESVFGFRENWEEDIYQLSGRPYVFPGTYHMALLLVHRNSNWITVTPSLTADEAWNIDAKMDDGHPAYGKVLTYRDINATAGGTSYPDCATTTTAATAAYDLATDDIRCALIFKAR